MLPALFGDTAEGFPGKMGPSPCDIAERDYADQALLTIYDRQAPNLLFGHVVCHVFKTLIVEHVSSRLELWFGPGHDPLPPDAQPRRGL
jgi:hypothetical protein